MSSSSPGKSVAVTALVSVLTFLKMNGQARMNRPAPSARSVASASRRLSVQRELFQRVNSPAYGMLLHLGNWDLDEGETADNNNLLAAPMAVHTHVNYEHAHRAETYLPLMREAGYQGLWGLEHHSGEDEYKKVARQLAEIRLANV